MPGEIGWTTLPSYILSIYVPRTKLKKLYETRQSQNNGLFIDRA